MATFAGTAFAEGPVVRFDSLEAGVINEWPLGTLADFYITGIGAGVQGTFAFGSVPNLRASVGLEYAYGLSQTVWVDAFNELGVTVAASYLIELLPRLELAPELALGILMHIVSGDVDRDGTTSTAVFTDSYFRLAPKLYWRFTGTLSAFLAPRFSVFTQTGATGLLFGAQAGVRINFDGGVE
jgi:hypothetical protein